MFAKTVSDYMKLSTGKDIDYLITLDNNDPKLRQYIPVCDRLGLKYIVGESGTKVRAINRDMDQAGEWDILVLASDDMICKVKGWDDILREEMQSHFPNLDGVLWHWDGAGNPGACTKRINGQGGLNTMCIFGKNYQPWVENRHIYHPDYASLFCDNEFTIIADRLGKQFYSEQVLFRHEHWANGLQYSYTNDDLMKKTQSYYQQDERTFKLRESLNFGLKNVAA